MKHMKTALSIVLICIFGSVLQAAPQTIEDAILSSARSIESKLDGGTRIAVLGCKSDSEHLSDYIIQEMIFALVQSGKLVVVDREDLDLLRSELSFQLSGEVSAESMQAIGEMLGAEVILTCTVDEAAYLRTKAVAVSTTRLLAVSSQKILEAGTFLTLTDDTGAMRTVTVRNVEELLQAIGPDRIIQLKPGTYNLSEGAVNAVETQNRYISWEDEFDGPCPVIKSVSNLAFRGGNGVAIVTEPAYGWVFSFETCTGISISDITMGHTVPGYCLGGVLRFKNCTDVEIRTCDLYGSGTIGIDLERTGNFTADSCIIRECTYGLLRIEDSTNVQFSFTQFKDTGEYDLISVSESDNVKWLSCSFTGNFGYTLFTIDRRSRNVTVQGGKIAGNRTKTLCRDPDRIDLSNVAFDGNSFD